MLRFLIPKIFHRVLLTLSIAWISDASHQSSLLDGPGIDFSQCKNMTVQERTICRSDLALEIQLNLQLESVRAQRTRAQSDEIRARNDVSAEFRANSTFVRAERSWTFPGLTVDPYDTTSVALALVVLVSSVGFGILNCCRHDSGQPMLIVNTFLFIMFTILNFVVAVDTSQSGIWLPVATLITVLTAVLPIHFRNGQSYGTVLSKDTKQNLLVMFVITAESLLVISMNYRVVVWPGIIAFASIVIVLGFLYQNCSGNCVDFLRAGILLLFIMVILVVFLFSYLHS
jgi:hypothetical protein